MTKPYYLDGRRVLRDTATETIAYAGPHYEARYTKTNKPEDLDDDCVVTVIDIMRVAARWGQAGGPEDVNGDGTVDVADVQQVAGKWRETCHVLAEVVKYYALGGQRIAMRQAGTLYYLFTDHLGSTSVSYNTANGQTQTLRYYPWGGVRSGDVPTDRRFTGQRWDSTIGLYDYNARWYDAQLGRFVQPDPIVPEPGNPQDLNRYSYVRNNPLTYNDPSGHAAPYRPIDIEIQLPSWAQSGLMRRALSVGCFFLSCHVDAERGVLTGPTPEEQITMAIQPMPMSVAGGVASNVVDDVADDVVRAGVKKVEQLVLPSLERFRNVGREAIPDVLKIFGDEGRVLGKVPDAFKGRGIRTIGRTWDVGVAEELGEHTFKPPAGVAWTAESNYAWILEGAEEGEIFYLASPVNPENLLGAQKYGGITAFGRELDTLLQAGYRRVGDYLVPPR